MRLNEAISVSEAIAGEILDGKTNDARLVAKQIIGEERWNMLFPILKLQIVQLANRSVKNQLKKDAS